MGRPRKKSSKRNQKSFETRLQPMFTRVLKFSGKPTYYALVIFLLGPLYGISFLGYLIRKVATYPFVLAQSITLKGALKQIFYFRERFKSLSVFIPSFKITTPKVPQIKFSRKRISAKKTKTSRNFKLPSFSFSFIKLPTGFYRKSLIVLGALSFISLASFWFLVLKDLPSPRTLSTRNIDVSTKIYDRNRVLLYTVYKDENRSILPLSDIPMHVRNATLAAEDAEFYNHRGFSVRGITRAFFRNLEKGELTGGSTITQQLVKNALLSPEKTFTRKIKEMVLAIEVELTYTKDEIFEMYLNEVSYGGTAYGIGEAAKVYFDKDVKELTLAEATYLAGLPRSPSKYSAFAGDFEAGINRQKDVLNLMVINKYVTDEDRNVAEAEKLTFANNATNIKAPHFVMHVRNELAEKYGEDVLETGGLEVVTTLDYGIQQMAEEVLKKEVDKLARLSVGNGAVVILDPKTGETLAMVGSKNYFDKENDGQVNVTEMERQPGSSIKLVNYAYALSHNYNPASVIDDTPVSFKIPGQAPYTPKNYDGNFSGKVSLRSALAQSLNIPAVRILNSYGVEGMIDLGQKMGITTWDDKSRFGLSLTLGGGEVKLTELAQVYGTVANYGQKTEMSTIKKITNYKGKVLEENTCQGKEKDFRQFVVGIPEAKASEAIESNCESTEVLDPRVAYMLIDILKDNNARSPAFGSNSQLVIKGHPEVAVKTGTSNDLRDNLTVGITQDYVVAVWVGNNDNKPMSRIASGLTGASTIFNSVMTNLLAGKESKAWQVPAGMIQVPVCTYTGSLPCGGCPTKVEWFMTEKKPTLACRSEQVVAYEEGQARQRAEGQILENGLWTEGF